MEKIKKDDNRVDLATLNSDEITGNDLTGGYIFRVDKLDEDYVNEQSGWTSSPSPSYPNAMDITYQYFYPSADDLAQEQKTYLRSIIETTEGVLIGNDFDDPDVGYNQYINSGSFVDFMLLNELSKEVDKYRYSTYFHKKKDSKGGEIFAGPAWDFNLGYSNVDYWDYGLSADGWLYEDVNDYDWSIMFWWKRLMEDSYFSNLTASRWKYLRQNGFDDENVLSMIDSIATYIDDAQQRNYAKWPILGTYVWPNFDWVNNTYSNEVEFLENWIIDRLDWMDDNISGYELYPDATISMIENNTNTKVLKVKLKLLDDYFNHSVLKNKYFQLNTSDLTALLDTVYFESASEAILAISYNSDFSSALDLQIAIEHKILNGFQDINTNKIDITSTQETKLLTAQISMYSSNSMLVVKCNRPEILPQSLVMYNTLGQIVGVYNLKCQFVNRIPIELDANIYVARIVADGAMYTQQIFIED